VTWLHKKLSNSEQLFHNYFFNLLTEPNYLMKHFDQVKNTTELKLTDKIQLSQYWKPN
jgi:hypothetical protein